MRNLIKLLLCGTIGSPDLPLAITSWHEHGGHRAQLSAEYAARKLAVTE